MPASRSVTEMWGAYHRSIGMVAPKDPVWDHFCDNESDANELSMLVFKGTKRATASALWSIEKTKGQLPREGSVFVVTDWNQNAVCVVKTTKVSILPFSEITDTHALLEGEGDLTLAHWKRVHIAFFENEFKKLDLIFSDSMPIVFEEFQKVFP